MGNSGRFISGLSLAIAGSFHVLIFPRKILASTGPVSLSSPFTSGSSKMITIPIRTAGNSTTDLPSARSWASGMGASPPPKSPAPESTFRALSADPVAM